MTVRIFSTSRRSSTHPIEKDSFQIGFRGERVFSPSSSGGRGGEGRFFLSFTQGCTDELSEFLLDIQSCMNC